ncbi:MAG: RCC1 domain-containing protein [bacterium]|nr:RCC1 domain-containing protein [bacterium]
MNGDAMCWNDGRSLPVRPPAGEFRAIDAGRGFTCGVAVTGGVDCWGRAARSWEMPEGLFVSVSSGRRHACGLRASGEVACWGRNARGETDAPRGLFRMVTTGTWLSCGLRPSGEAECWGDNDWWAASPPPGPFADLTVGVESACGRRPGGEYMCWGRWAHGPAPEGVFSALSMDYHFCGLRPGGRLECLEVPPAERGAWWYGAYRGFLYSDEVAEEAPGGLFATFDGTGDHACGLRFDATVDCWYAGTDWWPEAPDGEFVAVSAGTQHACGIRSDSTLECWDPYDPPGWGLPRAAGSAGPLTTRPSAAAPPSETPQRRLGTSEGLEWVASGAPDSRFRAIDSGALHTCGVRLAGSVQCWGASEFTRSGRFESVAVGGRGICELARPDDDRTHFDLCSAWVCAVEGDGEAACWSAGDYPTGEWRTLTEPEPAPGRVAALDVGFDVCAAQRTGGVMCGRDTGWEGTSRHWRAGPGSPADSPRTSVFEDLSVGYGWYWSDRDWDDGEGWLDDYGGPDNPSQHACAIATDGGLVCWGTNGNGETVVPPDWLGLAPYRDVAAGYRHTCALDRRGEAVCWGDGTHGQTDAPAGVFTQLSAGRWHTCGLRPDGEAECWGNGPGGVRNQFDAPPEGAPTAPPPGPYTQVAAGQWHTCALRPDGRVECWYSY